ncbi:MAG: fibronectin type III domain-containing protein [Candidatus Sumerlaeia bacterium]|nr:fibronectin type III domain-containing protein [Candidatus Sumerlaeia bacterium]
MRFLAAPLLFALGASAAAQTDTRPTDVEGHGDDLRQALAAAGVDGCDVIGETGTGVRVFLSAEQREALAATGLAWEVVPEAPGRLAVDGYFTLAEYQAAMTGWVASHPGIVSLTTIGTTWEGRPIQLLKISDNVALDEDEPEVLLISLQHAREWLAGMTLHGITGHLVTQHGLDAEVTDLVNGLEIFVVLVANPDGYVHTHTVDRYWRKNRRDNGLGVFGVDTNRNWDFVWSGAEAPSSNTYGGPAPFSEPENAALRDWILSRGGELVGMLNYHTYGTRVMHGWAHTYTLPPNADAMGPLVRSMADAIAAVNGQRFRNGAWSIALQYLGTGVTDDWVHAVQGVPTLTLELRPDSETPGDFAPTGASIAPSVSEHIPGAITFLEWALSRGGDVTPPVISDVAVNRISNTQATISWRTDDESTRLVRYGLTPSYGAAASPDRLRDWTHSVVLTGLTPGTAYHFQVESENLAALVSASGDMTFTTSATAQDITPPAAPAILRLRRTSATTAQIVWQNLAGETLSGYRLYESPDGTTWSLLLDESSLPAGTAQTALTLPANAMRIYRMTAVDAAPVPNESAPSDAYGIRLGPMPTEILIVDGNDSWASKPVAQGGNHDFAAVHGLAVSAYGSAFDTCANQETGGAVDLTSYEIVIWVLGEESTGNETFSAAEQALVQAFLQGGGRLMVSGSNVAWDLDRPSGPTVADRAFFNTYLCADYAGDNATGYTAVGPGGLSIFGTMSVPFDDGSQGIYRVDDPDYVTPLSGATAALRSGTQNLAIQRTGLFGPGTVEGRLVYFTFPFETIFPASTRSAVMADVLTYFGATVPAELSGFSAL